MNRREILALLSVALALTGCSGQEPSTAPTQAEDNAMAEQEPIQEPVEPVKEAETTLSEEEQEHIKTLVKYLTLGSNLLDQGSYEFDIHDADLLLQCIQVIGSMEENSTYIPSMKTVEAEYGLMNQCSIQEVQEYLKNVFGMENADLQSWMFIDGDNILFPVEWYDTEVSVMLDDMDLQEDGNYLIHGSLKMEYPELEDQSSAYQFTLLAEKNENSPLLFKVINLSYEKMDTSAFKHDTGNVLENILLYPAEHPEFYITDEELTVASFALADIDGDGTDEIFLSAESAIMGEVGTICNILKYDPVTEQIADYDGNRTYTNLLEFILLDTGVLMTEVGQADNLTYYWNLNTGEYWEACTALMAAGGQSAEDRTLCKFMVTPDGNVLEGDEAKELQNKLTKGNQINLIWETATEDSIRSSLLQK